MLKTIAIYSLLLLGLGHHSPVKAQRIEYGMLSGASYYYGDVVNELNVKNIRYGNYFFVRNRIDFRNFIRLNAGYTRIVGIDSISSSKFQRGRNLNFFTDIYEVSGVLEHTLIDDNPKNGKGSKLIPYVYGGIGLIYFVPQTIYRGATYNLAELQTSGIAYSQVALVIPVGIGIKYKLTRHWQVGADVGVRVSTSSDIDDIRGNSVYPNPANLPSDDSRLVYDRANQPKSIDTGIGYGRPGRIRGKMNWIPDMYAVAGVTISYKPFSEGRAGKKGCPRFY